MPNYITGNCSEVSYFVVDKLKKIVSFHLKSNGCLSVLIEKPPQIGENIVQIFARELNLDISGEIDKCLNSDTALLNEIRLTLTNENHLSIATITLPILTNDTSSYVVFILLSHFLPYQNDYLKSYSKFTSHELRAPVSNILSLANLQNYPGLESKYGERVKDLLADIYLQAEKLNSIINVLNNIIRPEESTDEDFLYQKVYAKHIVIVDDDAIVNKMHKKMLSKYDKNATINEFSNPKSALDFIYVNKPDLILLDINMPDIDGWSFLKKLESYPFISNVIIVSSSVDIDEKKRARKYPFVKEFVTKPLTWEKISSLLRDQVDPR